MSSPFDAPDADNAGAQGGSQQIYEQDGCVVLGLKRDGSPIRAIAWDCGGWAQVFSAHTGWDDPNDADFQDPIPANMGETPGAKLREREYHYVVLLDGSLRVVHNDDLNAFSRIAGHTSLSEGKDVIAAGKFEVSAAGKITYINNYSGHYWPSSDPGLVPLGEIVHTVFERNGWPFERAAFDDVKYPEK